ncbi:hypothetical protein QVD17_19766 [Tagetes erecta]|uniref:Uncharacterized protein n=1 Tax=Tagetes erecta TaxID=13708 RepID=A0AAD8KNM6_TARER|nr:hypothetical protein QVD17_19766 [Tagetes erecta]
MSTPPKQPLRSASAHLLRHRRAPYNHTDYLLLVVVCCDYARCSSFRVVAVVIYAWSSSFRECPSSAGIDLWEARARHQKQQYEEQHTYHYHSAEFKADLSRFRLSYLEEQHSYHE